MIKVWFGRFKQVLKIQRSGRADWTGAGICNMVLFYEENKISCGINVGNRQILEMKKEECEKRADGVGWRGTGYGGR